MKSTRELETSVTISEEEVKASRVKVFFPYVVLTVGIALSMALHFVIKDNIEGEAQLQFERQASDAQHVIAARIRSYGDVMNGLSAMFSATTVSRKEFNRYITGLDLARHYPAFWTFNYAVYVPHETRAGFET